MFGYEQRRVIAAVENVSNAIGTLNLFPNWGKQAIPVISRIIEELEEDGLEERDKFQHDFLTNWREHLTNLTKRD